MKFNIAQFTVRPVRLIVTVLATAFLFLSTTVPAFAFGTSTSRPTDGVEKLPKIERESQKVAESAASPSSLEESQERAQGGLNEVQGDANKDQMHTPSNSKGATTIRDQIGRALEKATNKD